MNKVQTIELAGKRYVVIEAREFERMRRQGGRMDDRGTPPALPQPDAKGRVPAIAYARASIARTIVEQRRAAGLSQQALASVAGIRQETLSRIESGKHTATARTVERLDRALKKISRPRKLTA